MMNRETIRQMRLELGLKQVEVAIAIRVSEHTISMWERGSYKPSKKHEQKLVKYLTTEMNRRRK